MNWLIIIPKKTNLIKFRELLSNLEVEFDDEFVLNELDENDYFLEVEAGSEFPRKLEDIDSSLRAYPNSAIDLY